MADPPSNLKHGLERQRSLSPRPSKRARRAYPKYNPGDQVFIKTAPKEFSNTLFTVKLDVFEVSKQGDFYQFDLSETGIHTRSALLAPEEEIVKPLYKVNDAVQGYVEGLGIRKGVITGVHFKDGEVRYEITPEVFTLEMKECAIQT